MKMWGLLLRNGQSQDNIAQHQANGGTSQMQAHKDPAMALANLLNHSSAELNPL